MRRAARRLWRARSLAAAVVSLVLAVALALVVSPSVGVYAQTGTREILAEYQNLTIRIDGKTIIPKDASGATVYPFVYEGRTFLPVRAFANALGCGVSWDDPKKAVSIVTSGGGSPSYGTPVKKGTTERVAVEYANITVSVDGKKLSVTNEPFLFKDSVYLPLREIADALGCTVDFDTATNVIDINLPKIIVTRAGEFSASDLVFTVDGKPLRLDDDISVATALFGAPTGFEEVESCAYDGMDKFFTYRGGDILVSTLPINGDLICAVDVFTDAVKTGNSITVGSSLEQIETAYGKDYTLDGGVLIYWAGPRGNPKTPQLYFTLDDDGVVLNFGIFNGKSAG
jgi:hypothetical protein